MRVRCICAGTNHHRHWRELLSHGCAALRSSGLTWAVLIASALSACGGSPGSGGGGGPGPADGPIPVAAWGDSFTSGGGASSPATTYPADLALLLDRRVINFGVGAQTSYAIAARQGGVPA